MQFKRSIFIAISLILIIGGVSLLVLVLSNRQQTNNFRKSDFLMSVIQSTARAISYEQYQKQLLVILNKHPLAVFKTPDGAQQVRKQVLTMSRLPAQAQATQLLLVLAADKIVAGKILESNVILEELGNKYQWLEWWVKQ